jgi:hypothetical protein
MVLFLTKLSHSLFLKQPMHNIGTEITKTITYLQYIQNTEKRLKKLQTLLLIILMKVKSFFPKLVSAYLPSPQNIPEALKSLYRSPGNKKKQLVLCKNYVLQW